MTDRTPIPVILSRVAAELADAATLCREAEALAAGLATDGDAGTATLAPLQSLDELTQRLASLAALLDDLAADASPDWRLDLAPSLANVRLGRLAARLAGAAPAAETAGDAEFF